MTRLEEIIQETNNYIEKLKKESQKNSNPLVDDKTLKLRLYGTGTIFFNSIDKLERYCLQNEISINDLYVLDYMNSLAGRKNVIRKINNAGRIALYTVIDENGYGKYNPIKSQEAKRPIWEYHEGSIEWMYHPFEEYGIKPADNIYEKAKIKYQYIRKKMKNHNAANKQ